MATTNSTLQTPLGLHVRDLIYVGTLVIGLGVTYGGLSARLGAVEETVRRIDARLWEIRGQSAASFTCPADATRVHVATLELGQ